MKSGPFIIEQLSEGQFELFEDGTIHRKPVTKARSKPQTPLGMRRSSRIGIDPILVSDGTNHILLDTGLGWGLDAGSRYKDVSNVKTNLDIFKLKPEDITHVILTHLHYDHAAGSSYTDDKAATRPVFPNARYIVQRREWEYALTRLEGDRLLKGADYQLDDLYRLVADGQLEFLDKDFTELLPGIKVLWTGGHTPGHQAIRIGNKENAAYYIGDLLPSEFHLNQYVMRQLDTDPLRAKKIKIQLLRTACEENAILLFYHSLYSKAGVLEKDKNRKYVIKEV